MSEELTKVDQLFIEVCDVLIERGLTNKSQLGMELANHRGFYRDVQKGDRRVQIDQLNMFVKLYSLNSKYFFEHDPEMFSNSDQGGNINIKNKDGNANVVSGSNNQVTSTNYRDSIKADSNYYMAEQIVNNLPQNCRAECGNIILGIQRESEKFKSAADALREQNTELLQQLKEKDAVIAQKDEKIFALVDKLLEK